MEPTSEFKVVPWRDYHGVETFFLVVAQDGWRCGIYPSEREAIAVAAARATEAGTVADPGFALETAQQALNEMRADEPSD
jgi:hypothetical protein